MYFTCADTAVTEAMLYGIFGTLGNNPHSALQTLPSTTKERERERKKKSMRGKKIRSRWSPCVEEDKVHLAKHSTTQILRPVIPHEILHTAVHDLVADVLASQMSLEECPLSIVRREKLQVGPPIYRSSTRCSHYRFVYPIRR